MKSIIILIGSLLTTNLTLINCGHEERNPITKRVSNSSNKELGYLSMIYDPNQLVALLDDKDDLEDEYIGLDGHKSNSFLIYKRLCDVASDTALIRLAHHKNPKIRVYSMWALINRNKELVLQQFQRLKDDESVVSYQVDDVGFSQSGAYLIATHFDSTEVEIGPINKKGFASFTIKVK